MYLNSCNKLIRAITVFLFHLLSTASKPFSSLSTRLAHAVRLGFFYKNALYKFTVIYLTFFNLPRPTAATATA